MSRGDDRTRITRGDVGSWVNGPPQLHDQDYPGQRMGRPESGPGSLARWGRRILALCIDWAIAMGIAYFLMRGNPWGSLIVFLVIQMLMVGFFGRGIGHWLLGMQVQKLDGRPANLLDGLVRTLLVGVVIPPLIQDSDQRGLHDKACKTVLVMVR
ncbi:MAG: RDD family protein [Galactobacter sp.]